MTDKPSYEELEQRVKQLEKEVVEYKHAEEGLRESEKKWRSLVKNAPSLILIVDHDGIIQYINHTVPGLEVEKVVGTNHCDYVPPEYHKVMKESVEQVFKTGRSTGYEIAGVGPDGSTSWYTTKLGPIWQGGEVVAVTIMPTDITERQRAEEALRESEERFRNFLDNLGDAAYEADSSGNITYGNKAGEIMTGVPVKDIMGKPFLPLFTKESQKTAIDIFQRTLDGESPAYELTFTNGNIGHFKNQPLRDRNGKIVGVFGIVRDITERRRAEQTLRERETALEIQAEELQEVNTALRVLLRQRDKDKTELEEKVFLNVRELVMPQVEKLKKSTLDARQRGYLRVLESNLNEIISPFAHRLSSKYSTLTPTEIQMAFLIRDGKTTKEIAELLNLSGRTIESHRQSIRMKMGIRNRRANLRSYLLSM